MLSETIVLSLCYVILIALLYAPKCPKMTATDSAPVDYFPEVTEPVEVVGEPDKLEPEVIRNTDSQRITGIPVTETASNAIAPAPSPDLKSLTIRQLKAMAKGKIKNYGNLTKAQLIDRLALA